MKFLSNLIFRYCVVIVTFIMGQNIWAVTLQQGLTDPSLRTLDFYKEWYDSEVTPEQVEHELTQLPLDQIKKGLPNQRAREFRQYYARQMTSSQFPPSTKNKGSHFFDAPAQAKNADDEEKALYENMFTEMRAALSRGEISQGLFNSAFVIIQSLAVWHAHHSNITKELSEKGGMQSHSVTYLTEFRKRIPLSLYRNQPPSLLSATKKSLPIAFERKPSVLLGTEAHPGYGSLKQAFDYARETGQFRAFLLVLTERSKGGLESRFKIVSDWLLKVAPERASPPLSSSSKIDLSAGLRLPLLESDDADSEFEFVDEESDIDLDAFALQHGFWNARSDGSCFWQVLAYVLNGAAYTQVQVQSYQQVALNHLLEHSSGSEDNGHTINFAGLTGEPALIALNQYIEEHLAPETWADDPIISAIVAALNLDLMIHQYATLDGPPTVYHIHAPSSDDAPVIPVIMIHVLGVHFMAPLQAGDLSVGASAILSPVAVSSSSSSEGGPSLVAHTPVSAEVEIPTPENGGLSYSPDTASTLNPQTEVRRGLGSAFLSLLGWR